MTQRLLLAAVVLAAAAGSFSPADAADGCQNCARGGRGRLGRIGYRPPSYIPAFDQSVSWHGRYYHTGWQSPVALVVPPTAAYQSKMGRGVGTNRMTPIHPQFRRPWPGTTGEGGFQPTPHWPSHTDQFGVYYVRGPW